MSERARPSSDTIESVRESLDGLYRSDSRRVLATLLREGERTFHTYSTYARGTDLLDGTYNYLDLTPLGRQEDWEEPTGRSNSPFLPWVRHHDRYGAEGSGCGSDKH